MPEGQQPENTTTKPSLVLWFVLVAGLILAYSTATYHIVQNEIKTAVVALISAGVLAGLFTRKRIPPPPLTAVVGGGILLRFVMLLVPNVSCFSDDIYRYVFEGEMILAGAEPWYHAPASARVQDASEALGLEDLRQRVNQPNIPAIYPPTALVLCGLNSLFGGGVFTWRIWMALFDLLAGVALLRLWKDPEDQRRLAPLWFLNPLVIIETTLSGHLDSSALAAMLWGEVFRRSGSPVRAWALLGCAGGIKILPFLLAPFWLSKGPRRRVWVLPLPIVASFLILAAVPTSSSETPREVRSFVVDANGLQPLETTPPTLNTVAKFESSGRRLNLEYGNPGPPDTKPGARLQAAPQSLERSTSVPFASLLGSYRVFHFLAHEIQTRDIEFDGQGGRDDPLRPRYWQSADGWFELLDSQNHGIGRFYLSEDGEALWPAEGGPMVLGLKQTERLDFAWRQYKERWSANSPWISALFNAVGGGTKDSAADRREKRMFLRLAVGVLVFLTLVWALFSGRVESGQRSVMLLVVILSPAQHPWYFLFWLALCLAHRNSRGYWCVLPVFLAYTGWAWGVLLCLAERIPGVNRFRGPSIRQPEITKVVHNE